MLDSAGHWLGRVGEIDPGVVARYGFAFGKDDIQGETSARERVGWLEIDLGAIAADAEQRDRHIRPVSKFPSSDLDLAFVVSDAVAASSVEKTLRKAAGDILESIALFDVYRGANLGPGVRSLAYRLRLCATDRTISDTEVAEVLANCVAAVGDTHNGSLRS